MKDQYHIRLKVGWEGEEGEGGGLHRKIGHQGKTSEAKFIIDWQKINTSWTGTASPRKLHKAAVQDLSSTWRTVMVVLSLFVQYYPMGQGAQRPGHPNHGDRRTWGWGGVCWEGEGGGGEQTD